MFYVNICESFSVLNVLIVFIRNTAVFKLIPLLCTHVSSYMFSRVHPPSMASSAVTLASLNLSNDELLIVCFNLYRTATSNTSAYNHEVWLHMKKPLSALTGN